MKVRVFVPKKLDPADGSDMDGCDYEFEVLPAAGQTIRFSDTDKPDFRVDRVGFIQDDEAFVACVWLERDNDVNEWIEAMTG